MRRAAANSLVPHRPGRLPPPPLNQLQVPARGAEAVHRLNQYCRKVYRLTLSPAAAVRLRHENKSSGAADSETASLG